MKVKKIATTDYDKMIWADTNEICFQCKRCCPKPQDISEMCSWHRSKGVELVPGSIVSDCRATKTGLKEGSIKILRCPDFIPDDQDDYTPMPKDEYERICDELPDILFQKLRGVRENLYARGLAYNNLLKSYNKLRRQMDALAIEYNLTAQAIIDIEKKHRLDKPEVEMSEEERSREIEEMNSELENL